MPVRTSVMLHEPHSFVVVCALSWYLLLFNQHFRSDLALPKMPAIEQPKHMPCRTRDSIALVRTLGKGCCPINGIVHHKCSRRRLHLDCSCLLLVVTTTTTALRGRSRHDVRSIAERRWHRYGCRMEWVCRAPLPIGTCLDRFGNPFEIFR